MRRGRYRDGRDAPCFELLEPRVLLSSASMTVGPLLYDADMEIAGVLPVVVAGDPNGSPPDSPTNRVDQNTTGSPFAGVGSLFMDRGDGTGYIGSGTVISPWHILTAAHVVDVDNDGDADFLPGSVTFFLNYDGSRSSEITASQITIHPDFTGFNRPSVSDDVAIIELSQPVPDGVPIYPLYTDAPAAGDVLTVVGYGRSGYGTTGYTTGASFTIKRVGGNTADVFNFDDEGSGQVEVFRADFDAPNGTVGRYGGASLGNDIETTLGGGDSGGPSFVSVAGQLFVFGINTFTFSFIGGPAAPKFGSGWGGIAVHNYLPFINAVVSGEWPPPVVETVDILKAEYHSSKNKLSIEATSSQGSDTLLQARYSTEAGDSAFQDMTYDSRKGRWTLSLSPTGTPLAVEIVSIHGASDSSPVTLSGGGGGGGGKPGKGNNNSTPIAVGAHQAAIFASYWHEQDDEPGTRRDTKRLEQVVDLLALVQPS